MGIILNTDAQEEKIIEAYGLTVYGKINVYEWIIYDGKRENALVTLKITDNSGNNLFNEFMGNNSEIQTEEGNRMKATYREIETVYTYNEWLKEYNRRESRKKIRQSTEHKSCTIQRFFGAVLLVAGTLAPRILWDATFSLFALPLGVYLILTREKVMVF